MQDSYGRKIEYLRVSVTDRCNLRCQYCMPQEGIEQFAHADCLTLEEIYRIVSVMADMGLKKVRFTGGEPMVRKNLVKLVGDVAKLPQIGTVAMTTNGVLFAEQVEEFAGAGLNAVNISLDTLDAKQFAQITGRDELEKVLYAVEQSLEQGLKVRINCVPVRELNGLADGQAAGSYLSVAELARRYPVDVRFIELMPIGCGRKFTGISGQETLTALEACYGSTVGIQKRDWDVQNEEAKNGPARYVRFEGFRGRIGFIDPLSHQFCSECNRLRLTVDGKLKLCLYYADGIDLKGLIRSGASDGDLRSEIERAVRNKPKEHRFLPEEDRGGLKKELQDRESGKAPGECGFPETRRMVQIGG
ncbi:MAG: GTP 3',8-cyclase MoaA [Lachnospiraceae bacterium]|nr:GTP 3',8-cyclase MoaA [Lachnospiraceae bacterium]